MRLMRIEIVGGPHDGSTIDIDDSHTRISPVLDPAGAAAFFAGIPLYQEGGKIACGGSTWRRWGRPWATACGASAPPSTGSYWRCTNTNSGRTRDGTSQ